MLTFATEDDVARFCDGDVPENIPPLIRKASTMVQHAVRFARFDVTPAGAPTDPDVSDALRDAVCAQIAMWHESNIDPNRVDARGAVTSSKIGDAQINYDSSQSQALAAAKDELCEESCYILSNAGLSDGVVWLR